MSSLPQPPQHVAVIMDGNGRWAQQRGKPRTFGHHAGIKSARAVVRAASDAGVAVLTLFAFSQENWFRPDEEVGVLMRLFVINLRREIRAIGTNNLRWKFIGDLGRLPPKLQDLVRETEAQSAHHTGMWLVVAVSYSGQWDILQAAQKAVAAGGTIEEPSLKAGLSTAGLPDVDLLIRTGGESRISNFLLWQAAYAELYFSPALWPEFGAAALQEALAWFAVRQRRFGRVLDAPHAP